MLRTGGRGNRLLLGSAAANHAGTWKVFRRKRTRKRASSSPKQIVELKHLDPFRVAHLATADARGKPLVVPVCFACGEKRIYSAVDEKPKRVAGARLRRLKNIEANPQVCLLVDHYEEDWSRLSYILVEGTAEILREGAEHRRAIALLREKYPQYQAMSLEQQPVIKITPSRFIPWKAA
ncbi:MAG: TIGR03668 family PPOX class F420-dependent oxidoreductase [Acidobacteria bacterium]|nr:TIGR03668 family PPOX class F420-dependent oxidoreductase [Acidobacteriota bacterium]